MNDPKQPSSRRCGEIFEVLHQCERLLVPLLVLLSLRGHCGQLGKYDRYLCLHCRMGASGRPMIHFNAGSSRKRTFNVVIQNWFPKTRLSSSCVAWKSCLPALDFEGSEILAIRRVSSAARGGAGGPTQTGAISDDKGPM